MPKQPQTSKVVTISAAHAVHDTYSGFLPPLLPVFIEKFALANGLYMALNFGIRSFIVVLVGGLGDWIGLRQTFLICAALGLLGTPLIAFLPGTMDSKAKAHQSHDGAD